VTGIDSSEEMLHAAEARVTSFDNVDLRLGSLESLPLEAGTLDILDKMRRGDRLARLVYRRYVDRLARGLALVVNILDPDVIVLGGGLSNIERLYDRVPRLWGPHVFSDGVATRLVRAAHGDSSGVRGAAWLWN